MKFGSMVKMFVSLLFIFVLIGLGSLFYWVNTPIIISKSSVQIEVKSGDTFKKVVQNLSDNNIVRWPILFNVYARFYHVDAHIKAGIYEFSHEVFPLTVIDKLLKGFTVLVEFSHPPGYNIWQIAEKLSQVFPYIAKQEWVNSFKDPQLIRDISPEATSLEGYLFPDVYRIKSHPNKNEVINMMLTNFKKNINPEMIEVASKLGFSLHKMVALASIIEKETGINSERPLISSVFQNRLKIKMRLQTDPTVIYGIWEHYDGNLHKRDLEEYTPYNTYVISGMPPGPIANPGRDALNAVIEPSESKFLYFVARGDGSHYFSKSLSEHNTAVYNYQIKPSRRKGANNGSL